MKLGDLTALRPFRRRGAYSTGRYTEGASFGPAPRKEPSAGATNAGDVREALDAARTDNKNSVLMRVKSGGSSRFVAVPIAKG